MLSRMVSWNEVEKAEPEFAAKVRGLFDAHKHKTIATLRADGSPRISGIEARVRRRRADVRVDAARAQGGRPAPRPAVRAAQRHHRSTGRRSRRAGPARRRSRGGRTSWRRSTARTGRRVSCSGPTSTRWCSPALNAEATLLVVESWRPGPGAAPGRADVTRVERLPVRRRSASWSVVRRPPAAPAPAGS